MLTLGDIGTCNENRGAFLAGLPKNCQGNGSVSRGERFDQGINLRHTAEPTSFALPWSNSGSNPAQFRMLANFKYVYSLLNSGYSSLASLACGNNTK